jgi:hypothetical protein
MVLQFPELLPEELRSRCAAASRSARALSSV